MKRHYLNRMLTARDPRYAKIARKLGLAKAMPPLTPPPPPDEILAEVRAAYREAIGRAPHHSWDVDTLREKIAAAKD